MSSLLFTYARAFIPMACFESASPDKRAAKQIYSIRFYWVGFEDVSFPLPVRKVPSIPRNFDMRGLMSTDGGLLEDGFQLRRLMKRRSTMSCLL